MLTTTCMCRPYIDTNNPRGLLVSIYIINHYSMKDRQNKCQQQKTKENNYSQNPTKKLEELICSTCVTVVLL